MDRLDMRHAGSRVELPNSIDLLDDSQPSSRRRWHMPAVRLYGALAGFMTCGAAVIATASFLALHIQ